MKRVYDTIVARHLLEDQQMLFLAGPRQVGKTTIGMNTAALTDNFCYLNWDNQNHRRILIAGPEAPIFPKKLALVLLPYFVGWKF